MQSCCTQRPEYIIINNINITVCTIQISLIVLPLVVFPRLVSMLCFNHPLHSSSSPPSYQLGAQVLSKLLGLVSIASSSKCCGPLHLVSNFHHLTMTIQCPRCIQLHLSNMLWEQHIHFHMLPKHPPYIFSVFANSPDSELLPLILLVSSR